MGRIIVTFVLLIGLLGIGPATAGPEEEANAVRRNFEQAFNSKNWDGMVKLFNNPTQYWGAGKNELIVSPDDLRAYFSGLPRDLKIELGEQSVFQVTPTTVLSAGFAVLTSNNQAKPVVLRQTIVMVNVDGRWLIVQFHASFMPRT
jgi:hypothetical protein